MLVKKLNSELYDELTRHAEDRKERIKRLKKAVEDC